tara:strand:+ start:15502 stop:19362 length:3861 start_codon:yes stop_codon:yes gene_type:complete
MHLSNLEIFGFKSFPERVELVFDSGVTAIVGPNGCGKSNVIDAITWVLGEQSARSLRGDRMEDVIFSGSDARRPTATAEVRLQLSQVNSSLTILDKSDLAEIQEPKPKEGAGQDNSLSVAPVHISQNGKNQTLGDGERSSDFVRQIEVGRRLFRSGESEYLLDGKICRLRDIQDLLMDSGVGIKAYAVIEQGKIGQILGARPMERRQLLEEAAGVTKYKSRRRSAELKLEAAQQNLTRVDDIVFEVEKQRNALKRQASKARRYRRFRENLRCWEKIQFVRRSEKIIQAVTVSEEKLRDVSLMQEEKVGQLRQLEDDHKKKNIEVSEADKSSNEAREAMHSHELAVGRSQQKLEFDKQQEVFLSESSTTGETEVSALSNRKSPLQDELKKQQELCRQCESQLLTAREKFRNAESSYSEAQTSITGMEDRVEASRGEVFSAVNSAALLEQIIGNAVEARRRVDAEIEKLDSELTDALAEKNKLESSRKSANDVVTNVRETLASTRLSRMGCEQSLQKASEQHDEHKIETQARETEVTVLSARLQSLKEIVAAREDYSDAARILLTQTDEALKHFGSVADHLDMDREYERSVEAGLADLLQFIIVESWQDALSGIELTSNHKAGRCGFLVLDLFDLNLNAPRLSLATGLRSFEDIVRVQGPAKKAVRSLLRRYWLADSVDDEVIKANVTNAVIVTPEGTVYRGSEIIYGGGRVESKGILGTKGEVKELNVKILSNKQVLEKLQRNVNECAFLVSQEKGKLETLQSAEHTLEKSLIEAELKTEQFDQELDRLNRRHDIIQTERRTFLEERVSLQSKREEAQNSVTRLEAERQNADQAFMGAQRQLSETRESLDLLSQNVIDAKTTYVALEERVNAFNADIRRLEDALNDLEQRLNLRKVDNQRTKAQRAHLKEEITESERRLNLERERSDLLRETLVKDEKKAAELRLEIEKQENEVQVIRQDVDSVSDKVRALEVSHATVKADQSNLSVLSRETFQMDLDALRLEVETLERSQDRSAELRKYLSNTSSDDLDELDGEDVQVIGASSESSDGRDPSANDSEDVRTDDVNADFNLINDQSTQRMVAEIKLRIERLGPVNMMAIDQFDELEERYEFLTVQRKDLLDAIQSTMAAIKNIDTTTRERFRTAFTAINEHFQDTFSTLFGGGRAGLVLIDETDLLESGIDIIAQPPGKRLQSVQLLSGGEKALTAMALMFAIFKYKPSPFCLLDEIDAPLDEANISRFITMLRGMQDETQFVLVTHNRKTMEIADRLYGVTMEEPGVSKLISVGLN